MSEPRGDQYLLSPQVMTPWPAAKEVSRVPRQGISGLKVGLREACDLLWRVLLPHALGQGSGCGQGL